MLKTFVILSRLQGSSDIRVDEKRPWEMIIPIQEPSGFYRSPVNLDKYTAGWAFKQYLLEGDTILVNPYNGSWNSLKGGDQILKIWQK